jgi:hypothetical protein
LSGSTLLVLGLKRRGDLMLDRAEKTENKGETAALELSSNDDTPLVSTREVARRSEVSPTAGSHRWISWSKDLAKISLKTSDPHWYSHLERAFERLEAANLKARTVRQK